MPLRLPMSGKGIIWPGKTLLHARREELIL
ncbi:hypothetical protein VTL71DRAFT_7129 [Oculimacula yallundae]|uniref:Uncharacterized protein n=1 Tax=Oculimacula yallundae TaxID=86028 RepID=A0ABR4BVX8_9HELO